MKMHIIMALLISTNVFADVGVIKNELGSGTPGTQGVERALVVDGDVYHAPQYMPNYPTAAPIWPRVIEVPCTKTDTVLKCDGYTWQPKLGRGEYLFITPIITKEPEAVVKTVVIPGKTVYVEVPVKPKKQ